MVDDVEGLPVGVVARHRTPADGQVDLLGVVVDGDVGLGLAGRPAPHPAVARRHAGERRRHVGDDVVVVDVAGDGDRRRAGAVVLGEEVAHVARADRAHRRPLTGGVPAEAVVAEQLPGERPQGDVVGRVVVHRQLLQDHLALALDVGVGDQGVGQHVAEQLDAGRAVAARHPAVVRRVLLGGEGVDVAADAVDDARDVGGRSCRGPLEQQVLEEVADARQLGRLVARADGHPDADRHRPRPMDVIGGDRQTVGELGDALAHAIVSDDAGGHGRGRHRHGCRRCGHRDRHRWWRWRGGCRDRGRPARRRARRRRPPRTRR